MNQLKGQASIAVEFIFAITLMMTITIALIMSNFGDEVLGGAATVSIDEHIGAVKDEAFLNYLLYQDIDRNVDSNREYNADAYRVIQEYFNTDNSNIKINGSSYTRSNVEQDIESYISNTFEEVEDSNPDGRRAVNLTKDGQYIEVWSNDENVDYWNKYSRDIAVSSGKVEVILWSGY